MTSRNMKSGLKARKVGAWLSGKGPQADIVISSRIRLARNVAGVSFLPKASPQEQKELVSSINRALAEALISNGRGVVNVEDLSPLEAQFLLERHLISADFLKSKGPRGFFATEDETFSLMINEEDHLRLQVLASGLSLKEAFKRTSEIEERLNSALPFAYSERYGFLTACPTNVGTGMRASILIHVPGVVVTREIDRVLRGVLQLGLSVRGTYGEGTETKGHIFQISNQRTLGQSEEEIVETLIRMTEQLIRYERDAREYLSTKMDTYIEDKIMRSFGILRYARTLTSEEALNLLSALRLGLGSLKGLDAAKINKLMILTRPANLQFFFDEELSPEQRDRKRAELIREALKDVEA
ncbi:MAG: protein arginine kinase [Candidatus Stahlbacteria bacterium]|nr:MAG: protein arginine kinase [Candidatus Stahlbacteria bacterium]